MTKCCPLTRNQYGYCKACLLGTCVFYDEKEDICLIKKALESNGAEVLKIREGHIALEGYNYGFIGGASGRIDNKIIFFGNIQNHLDYDKIKSFIYEHNKEIQIICAQMPLTDIGGIVTKE